MGQQEKGVLPSPLPGNGVWWLHTQILADTSGQCGCGQILDTSMPQFPHGRNRDDKDNTYFAGLFEELSQ